MGSDNRVQPSSAKLLRSLFDASQAEATTWSASDLSAMLRHQLTTALAVEINPLAERSALAEDEVRCILASSKCVTFADALSRDDVPVELLRLVKDYAKAATARKLDIPCDVARVLYVAALRNGRRLGMTDLTSLDDASIEREARRCLAFGWLDEGERGLLRTAS